MPEISEYSDTSGSVLTPELSEKSDNYDASEVSDTIQNNNSDFSEDQKYLIRQIVRAEIQEFLSEQKFPNFQSVELPPPPEKVLGESGRRVTQGKRIKFASTCDSELFATFEAWRKKLGLNTARAIDTVLWNFFNKPQLSFQKNCNQMAEY